MLGQIKINQLQCNCIVGILPAERIQTQDIFIDLTMNVDFTKAATSESVVNTIDYAQVASQITEFVKREQFQLIETMAVAILKLLLTKHKLIESTEIEIFKPKALAGIAQSPSVRLKIKN